jgi:hypothetical protein
MKNWLKKYKIYFDVSGLLIAILISIFALIESYKAIQISQESKKIAIEAKKISQETIDKSVEAKKISQETTDKSVIYENKGDLEEPHKIKLHEVKIVSETNDSLTLDIMYTYEHEIPASEITLYVLPNHDYWSVSNIKISKGKHGARVEIGLNLNSMKKDNVSESTSTKLRFRFEHYQPQPLKYMGSIWGEDIEFHKKWQIDKLLSQKIQIPYEQALAAAAIGQLEEANDIFDEILRINKGHKWAKRGKQTLKILPEIENGKFDNHSNLTFLTNKAAESLAKHKGDLSLRGITSLSDTQAESLAKHSGSLHLDGLTSLSDAQAESLGKHSGGLYLTSLTSLSDAQAESLAKHSGGLYLTSLTSLSDAQAESLGKHSGSLYLRYLSSLSDAQAESLAKHSGGLFLSSLTSLSDAQAESFAKHSGRLSLSGLTSLSDAQAESLAKHKGDLDLPSQLQKKVTKYRPE